MPLASRSAAVSAGALVAGAAVAGAVVLALAGRTTPPSPQPAPASPPAATPAATPGLPHGFPTAVPLLPGRVVAGSVDDGDLHAWVASADPEDGYRRARQLLVAAGFILTKDRVATGGGDGQACTSELCVSFTGSDDPAHGQTVQYDVFHGTGIVG